MKKGRLAKLGMIFGFFRKNSNIIIMMIMYSSPKNMHLGNIIKK